MLQDAQAMVDRLVDLTRHAHPGIRLNAVWALMVCFSLLHLYYSIRPCLLHVPASVRVSYLTVV